MAKSETSITGNSKQKAHSTKKGLKKARRYDNTVLWRNPENTSLEYLTLRLSSGGYMLNGTVLLLLEHQPTKIAYQVCCDNNWRTEKATVYQETAGEKQQLTLTVDSDQHWQANNKPLPFADGMFDVDFEVSPSTNTLPIRRLNIAEGDSKEIEAVWVHFPSLTLEPLRQKYTRLSKRLYLYEAPKLHFEAQLEVDEVGLVIKYGELWMRIA